ncbi:response regulator transcription factor [Clostridium sp. PL3]|uniref:Response regulator transcription factor n=1 Tax=Clostridium thailandense TaxID=2794346 RepID=A0A949U453_9CLOT|nr:LytTR family DNA-binding domain-containing protein [Clostridium thailandense]MBV7276074.1 response regulator transcription factor [Clostridium thailandense]
MLDIIICEDNNYQRKVIEDIIINQLKKLNLGISIALTTDNPDDVIKYVEDRRVKPFIYFLDVELKSEINGIELAKKIRKYDPMGYIVFVTSHAELTLLTFEYKVQAMDYIVKNDLNKMENKINECIKEAYNDYKSSSVKTGPIQINVGNKVIYFNPDDILFFETTDKNHRIRIHTKDETIEFHGTLKEIEEVLPDSYYKPHRSYLVNTKKIKCIDKKELIIHMINNETCYIALRYLNGLLKKC